MICLHTMIQQLGIIRHGKEREGKGGYSGRDIETLRSGSLVEPFTTLVRFFRQRVLYAKVDQ